ncbi:MAG: proline dehydrogenase family protein [Bacteroidales bacterium]|jgi:proline dehydrogenase|nr:proline dehydrogenase family protein [Bacteroidales bacterium]
MISLDNTQKAFRYKSDSELKRAHFLFNSLKYPVFVTVGSALVNIALKLHIPIKWAVKPFIYKHFVGGETLEDSINAIDTLAKYNVKSILDFSVEGKETDKEIERAFKETLRAVEFAGGNKNIPFAVFKPTALTKSYVLEKRSLNKDLTEEELKEFNKFEERIDKLCSTAYNNNKPILIDAEDSWFQNAIDEVTERMMAKYNRDRAIVYNTLQMYRTGRLEYLQELHKKSVEMGFFVGAKFVRGAYMEKERERAEKYGYPSPIQPDKPATDNNYNSGLEYSMNNIDRISIFNGTHNEDSCMLLIDLMDKAGIKPTDERVWFSQLYGMSDNISFNIADAGYNVAKYLPYGPVNDVMPYLLRRATENTSVKGQTGRELSLILREIKRRKNDTGK